jgi:hypothetical protein
MNWLNGFFIPLIEITFILGIVGFLLFYIGRAVRITWKRSFKYFIKYKIFRNKYPEPTIAWCLKCVDGGIGWYDAKKLMLIKMYPQDQIYETLYIYDQVLNKLNKEKGGENNGRKLTRGYSKIEGSRKAELPSF